MCDIVMTTLCHVQLKILCRICLAVNPLALA